jgi:uncharacterized membrane protein (GlpM family)
MNEAQPANRFHILRLVFLPGLITLAVTVLRLVGELQRWSRSWFNPEQGGGGAVVGIIWLAPVFGIYFALKLSSAGEGPQSVKRAIALALVGTAAVIAFGVRAASFFNTLGLQGFLICEGGVALVAAALQYPAWPRLFKVLTAYTVTARIPVVVVMFFALRGSWGTHYDAVPSFLPADFGFWRKFVLLGLIPQLTFWVGLTIVFAMLFGCAAVVITRRLKPAPRALA